MRRPMVFLFQPNRSCDPEREQAASGNGGGYQITHFTWELHPLGHEEGPEVCTSACDLRVIGLFPCSVGNLLHDLKQVPQSVCASVPICIMGC